MKKLVFWMLFCMQAVAPAFADNQAQYEVPRNQLVSEVLNLDVIEGPHYSIENTVRIYDGFMHNYTVSSDFGTFEVTGDSVS